MMGSASAFLVPLRFGQYWTPAEGPEWWPEGGGVTNQKAWLTKALTNRKRDTQLSLLAVISLRWLGAGGSYEGDNWILLRSFLELQATCEIPIRGLVSRGSLSIVPNMLCSGGTWTPNPDSLAGVHHPTPDPVWSHS